MTKKYDSQKTIETILAVSADLFLEKGYDKTSMRNIIERSGFSKGAIYHHFKSKEEIFHAVSQRHEQQNQGIVEKWLHEMKHLCGKDKLEGILKKTFASDEIHSLDKVMEAQVKSAEFILSYMRSFVNVDAKLIASIIEEGNKDGSLTVEYPEESAEVFLLLINIWCDPVIFGCNNEKLQTRLKFIQHIFKQIGMDILNNNQLEQIYKLICKLYFNTNINEKI